MAQRIVRAKRKLRDNHARLPHPAGRPSCRTASHAVLAAIALIFTEGHTATSGDELVRVDLSARGDPARPGARGADARRARGRRPARPDAAHRRPTTGPARRRRLDGPPRRPGPVAVGPRRSSTRATSSCGPACAATSPARSRSRPRSRRSTPTPPTADATDWSQIVALYDQLHAQRPNAVVAMNRAIAIGELARPGRRPGRPRRARRRAARRLPAVPRRAGRPAGPSRPPRRRRSPPTTGRSSSRPTPPSVSSSSTSSRAGGARPRVADDDDAQRRRRCRR